MELKNIIAELERALYSRYHQAWETHQIRGSLDPRRAYRALGGSTDVFRRKDIREERRSAVSLVVDGSDSMNYNGGAEALEGMVNGFQEVFRNSAVNWELTSFVTCEPSDDAQLRKQKVQESTVKGNIEPNFREYTRTRLGRNKHDVHTYNFRNVLRHGNAFRFKKFGTLTPKTKLGGLCKRACIGGTADAQVYRLAMQRLAKQEESTKLLIFLGDGQGQGIEFLARVSAEAEANGIITLGIGLGKDAHKAVLPYAFDAHLQVNSVRSLKVEAFRSATDTINNLRKERCK